MIIKAIELENWKLFRDTAHFEFSPDITLIVGPNEAGKSTLVGAISRGLYDKHTTGAAEVASVRPWGTKLSPRVMVEFENSGDEYRIEKTFLASPTSVLQRKVGGKWEKVANGDGADKQVCALLDTELYEHGASKPEHRGLAQLLWMHQGTFELPADLNETATGKLQSVLGAVAVAPEAQQVTAAIEERFGDVFTPKQMNYSSGSQIKAVAARLAEVEEEQKEVAEKLSKKGKLAHQVQETQVRLRKAKEQLEDAEQDLAEKEDAKDAAQEHREQRIKAESEFRKAKDEYEKLAEQIAKIKEFRKAIQETEEGLEQAEHKLAALQNESNALADRVEAQGAALSALKDRDAELDSKLRNLRIHHDLLRDEEDLEKAGERLGTVSNLRGELDELNTQLDDLQAPTDEELDALRQLSGDLREKQAVLKERSLSVSFRAEGRLEGTVDDGDETSVSLDSGDEASWTAPREIVLDLEGLGRFEARSGSAEAANLEEQVEDLEQKLQTKLATHGADDLDDAAAKANERRGLESSRANLQEQIEQQAPDGIESLKQKVRELEAKVKTVRDKAQPLDDELAGRLEDLDVSHQRQVLADEIERVEDEQGDVRGDIETARGKVEAVEKEGEEKDEAIQSLKQHVAAERAKINTSKDQLEDLEDDGMSQEEREQKRKELVKEYEKAETLCEALEEEKEEREERPKDAYGRAKKRAADLADKERSEAEQLKSLEGELRSLSEEGLYERESELAETQQQLSKRKTRLEVDAEAIKLLKLLKDHFQQERLAALVEPVRRIVEPNFRRLVGPRYENLQLDRDMRPAAVTVGGWDTEADSAELSFGTREQLAFLVRLALGELLGEDERVTVVLDDPLVNTDPARLDEALGIIGEAAGKMQLFILTCHELAYAGLESRKIQLGG